MPAPADPLDRWKRTLVVVWLSQFLSIAAFAFGLPFVAYYMQELGVRDQDALLFYLSLFNGAAPLSFALAAPLWGAAADRWGRRPMLIRANGMAMLVLLGMGLAESVGALIVLRIAQGALTGTIPAAQTLIATATPDQRQGLALGTLSTAVFAGMTAGTALGGRIAETLGYAEAYLVSACLSGAATLLIVCGTRERFRRPPRPVVATGTPRRRWRDRLGPTLGATMPLLVVVAAVSFCRQYEIPLLPLLVQDLRGGRLAGSAGVMGDLAAVGAVAAMVAGAVMGALCDRWPPARLASLCAVATALCVVPFAFAPLVGLGWLFVAQFAGKFAATGLDPVFQAWLSRVTPTGSRGTIFGWASTARALGWMFGPLAASGVAAVTGIVPAFWPQVVCFLALVPLCHWAARRLAGKPTMT